MQNKARQAKRHLSRLRQLVSQTHSPFAEMSEEEAIEKMRKVREEMWETKVAVRS
jgi:hypothetical protein